MTNPAELAILTVKGQRYRDWETVSVTHALNQMHSFRFTCSEGMPIAANYGVLKIKPGDDVTIALAGVPAFAGKVESRQVFYDANKHHIEIQGRSSAEILAQTSVVTKTGEFKNIDFGQLCRAICKPLGVNFSVEGLGSLPTLKFPRISIAPHQSGWEVIEQYARHVGVPLTSNVKGDLVALAGKQPGGGAVLVEGKNILEAREIIFNSGYEGQYGAGQLPANDDKWGANATSVPFIKSDPSGLLSGKGLAGTAAEIPAWTQDHLKNRVNFEKSTIDRDAVTVQVTVQGWLMPSGGLWGPIRANFTVTSPMLVANGMSLILKEVTFTQDNKSGTRSLLTLCNDIALGEGVPALSGSQVSDGGGDLPNVVAPPGAPGIGHA